MAILESFIRHQLDAANNGKGRIVNEYRLLVRVLENDVLALELAPVGFESEVVVFGIAQATALDPVELTQLIADRAGEATRLLAQVQSARDAEAAQKIVDAKMAEDLVAADVATRQMMLGGKPVVVPGP